MTDWTEAEDEHIWEGIKVAGDFCTEIGKTDLDKMDRDELIQVGRCILQTVVEQRLDKVEQLDDEIPF